MIVSKSILKKLSKKHSFKEKKLLLNKLHKLSQSTSSKRSNRYARKDLSHTTLYTTYPTIMRAINSEWENKTNHRQYIKVCIEDWESAQNSYRQ